MKEYAWKYYYYYYIELCNYYLDEFKNRKKFDYHLKNFIKEAVKEFNKTAKKYRCNM
ncbi:hypothetical protein [Methanothermococcus sp.]|uniref:hypothetical protein n=1 Tax=Methanothermococcus sp. TaxID=2614238 RepID=UPI0025EACF40|nr:hypothetical protein [Methanothermococcus sp.]